MNKRTGIGGILQKLVQLTSIVLRPEPLETEIDRHCKQAGEQTPYPERGETALQSGGDNPRLWCANCRYGFNYPATPPSKDGRSGLGPIVIAFILYADTLLSIHQITRLFEGVYDTVATTIREIEAALGSGFYLVWESIQHTIGGPTQIDETGHKCLDYKEQTPPQESPSCIDYGEDSRSRWEGTPNNTTPNDTMTLIGPCRDVPHVIRPLERGAQPEDSSQHSMREKSSREKLTRSSTGMSRRWSTPKSLSLMWAFISTKSNASGRSSTHGYRSSAAFQSQS